MASFYKFNFYTKTAYVSLTANKLRSFLSILGIVFGIVAVIVIISLGEGAKKEIIRQIELLGIKNIYIRSIPQKAGEKQKVQTSIETKDIEIIKSIAQYVEECAAIREIPSLVIGEIKEISHQIISVTPSFFRILDLKFFTGRPILNRDIKNNNLIAVLGHKTALTLGNKASPGESIRLGNNIFKIVGILTSIGGEKAGSTAISTRNFDELIIIPFGSEKWIETQSRKSDPNGSYGEKFISEIIVKTNSAENVIETAGLIKMALGKKYINNKNYQIVTPFALLNRSKQTKDMFNLFLLSIASVSLLVGGIGIMNIMLATVSERKKEIGIRRSVGAKKRHIVIQFLTESILLTVTGGVVGIVLGMLCILVIGRIAPWPVTITPGSILLPLIISSITGICSGSYPAIKAAKMDPVEALAV
jgi:putative ABC transport system permease protein